MSQFQKCAQIIDRSLYRDENLGVENERTEMYVKLTHFMDMSPL